MRAAQRAHENLMRKQAKEQKEKLQREQTPSLSKGNGLEPYKNNNLISYRIPVMRGFFPQQFPTPPKTAKPR